MPFPTENEASYRRTMEYIKHLDEKYQLDQRDRQDITNLYDKHYWLVRELERLENILSDIQQIAKDERPIPHYDGRNMLAGLIPATYKPMCRDKWRETGDVNE